MAFEKGKPKTGGRKVGTPNRTTADLKEAILAGAEAVGMDGKGKDGVIGYCTFLARDEPKAFAVLLGKVLPMQVENDPENPFQVVFKTIYEQGPSERP